MSQRIDISIPSKKIDPTEGGGTICPDIEITHSFNIAKMREFEIKLDTKVPKELSILPQVNSEDIATVEGRKSGKVYIQIGSEPAFATLEQIKELNTKTVFVDKLSDTQVQHLSNEDIVMLKKE